MMRRLAARHTLALLASTLVLAATGAAPATAVAAADSDCLRLVGPVDVQTDDVLRMQAAMDAGTVTSVDLVSAYLHRIEAYDRSGAALNSVRAVHDQALAQAAALDEERARSGARGPLHGVPVLLKDNVGTMDLPTTAGSIALEHNIPVRDAFLTARLRAAGAVILGKTNLSEFANWMATGMPNGYSSLGGQVIAPYDVGLDPSGSSTGSGVAATMAFAAAAIGTETSGSIISPATRHSLVAVKPTLGLVSRAGIIPLAPSFDTAGPMTRTVTDAAVLLGAVTGVDQRDPATAAQAGRVPAGGDYTAALRLDALTGARIGVRQSNLSNTSASGLLFAAAVDVLEAAGATIVAIPDAVSTLSTGSSLAGSAIDNDFKKSLNAYLATEASGAPVRTLTEIIAFNLLHPDKVKYGQDHLEDADATTGSDTDPQYLAARTGAITSSQTWIDTVMSANELDAIATLDGGNTGVTAAAGYPNVTVPMGYTGITPRGIAFAGGAYDEAQLLGFAYAYEQRSLHRVSPTQFNPTLVPPSCGSA